MSKTGKEKINFNKFIGLEVKKLVSKVLQFGKKRTEKKKRD